MKFVNDCIVILALMLSIIMYSPINAKPTMKLQIGNIRIPLRIYGFH